ncbi:hypothetical protein BIFBIF_00993 [Bifidobacterium bifidum ATCC 29521 = JCM 1255 = DSM 20456]|nr:hypothetical protein BIFBIF_00993 [Bifidobacterium bifidum ATCC 29521 = JCM 1255 = DSM 20456]
MSSCSVALIVTLFPSESIWPSVEPHREVASAAPMSSVLPAWLDTLRT